MPSKRGKFVAHSDIPHPFTYAGIVQDVNKWRFPTDDPAMFSGCDLIISLTRKTTNTEFPNISTVVYLCGPNIHDGPTSYRILRTAWNRKRLFSGIVGLKAIT